MIYTASKVKRTICKARKRRKQLSKFEKGQIVAWAKEDVACREIARRLKRNESRLRMFLKKYRSSGSYEREEGCGRPRKTTKGVDCYIVRQALKNRRISAGAPVCCVIRKFP